MVFRVFIAAVVVLLSTGGALAQGPFDGAWSVQQSCPTQGNVKGYTLNFDMSVKEGQVSGQRGATGTPDSSTLIGSIAPDGSARLRVDGLTGDAMYNMGGVGSGQPYSYPVSATFQQGSGTGSRADRPCTFVFRKVGASVGSLQTAVLCGQRVSYRLTVPGTTGGTAGFIGVWQGEYTATNTYQREYYRCLGIIIESIAGDGTIGAKYAFGDSLKFSMQGSFATKPSQGSWKGQIVGNAFNLDNSLRHVRLSSGKRLEGIFVNERGQGPVWFERQ